MKFFVYQSILIISFCIVHTMAQGQNEDGNKFTRIAKREFKSGNFENSIIYYGQSLSYELQTRKKEKILTALHESCNHYISNTIKILRRLNKNLEYKNGEEKILTYYHLLTIIDRLEIITKELRSLNQDDLIASKVNLTSYDSISSKEFRSFYESSLLKAILAYTEAEKAKGLKALQQENKKGGAESYRRFFSIKKYDPGNMEIDSILRTAKRLAEMQVVIQLDDLADNSGFPDNDFYDLLSRKAKDENSFTALFNDVDQFLLSTSRQSQMKLLSAISTDISDYAVLPNGNQQTENNKSQALQVKERVLNSPEQEKRSSMIKKILKERLDLDTDLKLTDQEKKVTNQVKSLLNKQIRLIKPLGQKKANEINNPIESYLSNLEKVANQYQLQKKKLIRDNRDNSDQFITYHLSTPEDQDNVEFVYFTIKLEIDSTSYIKEDTIGYAKLIGGIFYNEAKNQVSGIQFKPEISETEKKMIIEKAADMMGVELKEIVSELAKLKAEALLRQKALDEAKAKVETLENNFKDVTIKSPLKKLSAGAKVEAAKKALRTIELKVKEDLVPVSRVYTGRILTDALKMNSRATINSKSDALVLHEIKATCEVSIDWLGRRWYEGDNEAIDFSENKQYKDYLGSKEYVSKHEILKKVDAEIRDKIASVIMNKIKMQVRSLYK